MLEIGIIRPSQSPMASPLVCVLKGRDGRDGVHLKVDYRYVNRFTRDDILILNVYFNVVIVIILYVLLIVRLDLGNKYFV